MKVIRLVCNDCGRLYGKEVLRDRASFWYARCDKCGRKDLPVTDVINFGYLHTEG